MALRVAVLLAGAVLAGCTTTPPMRSVSLAEACAPSVAALAAHPALAVAIASKEKLPAPQQFADYGSCLERGDTRVGAALFRIDAVPLPSQVTTTLWANARGTLAAQIEVLDTDYRVLRTIGFDQFVRRGMVYSFDLFLNADDGAARFILVSPDPAKVGSMDDHVTSQTNTMYVGTGYYSHGTESVTHRPLTDAGQIQVTVRTQSSAPLKN